MKSKKIISFLMTFSVICTSIGVFSTTANAATLMKNNTAITSHVQSTSVTQYNITFIMTDGANAIFGWGALPTATSYSIGVWNLDSGGYCTGSEVLAGSTTLYTVDRNALTQGTYVCSISAYDSSGSIIAQKAIKFAYNGYNNFTNLGYI